MGQSTSVRIVEVNKNSRRGDRQVSHDNGFTLEINFEFVFIYISYRWVDQSYSVISHGACYL